MRSGSLVLASLAEVVVVEFLTCTFSLQGWNYTCDEAVTRVGRDPFEVKGEAALPQRVLVTQGLCADLGMAMLGPSSQDGRTENHGFL